MTRFGALAASLVLIAIVIWSDCSRLPTQQAGGSGSETVFGKALMPDGCPAAKAAVRVRPVGYLSPLGGLPANNAAQYIDAATDDSGRFSVSVNDIGRYCLEINNNAGHALLRIITVDGISVTSDLGIATLEKTASIAGMALDAAGGAVQIFGLERLASIDSATGAFSFSDLPAGTYSFRLVPKTMPQSVFSISSVKLDAGDIQNVSLMSGWTSSKRLYFNTTASGANVSAVVNSFPVLVRLTVNMFDFGGAQSDGSDIRFAKSDNTPLLYEIERWDPVAELAEVWVKVDTVYGNDSTHYIIMSWGNPTAIGASSGAAVFDTSSSFQGVWHMNDPAAAQIKDATFNGYNGIRYNMAAGSGVTGIIGIGQEFRGDSGYITMPGTAAGKLNFPENGIYSLSAWVYVDTLDSLYQTIVSKGDEQYNLEILDSAWEFAEYENKAGWAMSQSPSPLTPRQWVHVAGVRNQARQYLFVNGQCVDSVITMLGNGFSRSAGYDLMIGKTNGALMPGFPYYFHGIIDEIRISNRALSLDWIKLCYMNQKTPDALILW